MIRILLAAILISAPAASQALATAPAPADTTITAPSILGVAKALLGFMSTQVSTPEDSLAVKIMQQSIGAAEAGDMDSAITPIKDAAIGAAGSLNIPDELKGAIPESLQGLIGSGAGTANGTSAAQPLPKGTDTSFISRMNPQTFFLNVPAANYSGITALQLEGLEGDFLLVDDKSETEGFRRIRLTFDEQGQIVSAADKGFTKASTGATSTDGEGIVYDPRRGTVLISREATNEIIELGLDGKSTGRYLHTASYFPKNGNAGLESLTYSNGTGRFWTTTEGVPEGEEYLRIQSYAPYFWPLGHWFYKLDKPEVKNPGAIYVYGVSELCALPDGSLLVLEREANIPGTSIKEAAGASVACKLYLVQPHAARRGKLLEKHLLTRIDTGILDLSFANYEGMCLGPKLPDGGQVLILVADSQAGYKGVLRDWFKTIVLK